MIDFSTSITERTRDFTGREWVFAAVAEWLARPDGGRFFVVTGEPGSGKNAVAARLAQFSRGEVSPPSGRPHLAPGFLSAIRFCSARDDRWIDPHVFAESLALWVAARHPAFARTLAERGGDRQITINADQRVGVVADGGQVTGVIIKHPAAEPLSRVARAAPNPGRAWRTARGRGVRGHPDRHTAVAAAINARGTECTSSFPRPSRPTSTASRVERSCSPPRRSGSSERAG